jgi:hypothetical protein
MLLCLSTSVEKECQALPQVSHTEHPQTRPGIAPSTNALKLMEIVGLPVEETS